MVLLCIISGRSRRFWGEIAALPAAPRPLRWPATRTVGIRCKFGARLEGSRVAAGSGGNVEQLGNEGSLCLHVASSDFAELPLSLAIVDDPGWIVEAAVKN